MPRKISKHSAKGRGGPRPNSGGKRPGAGRPVKEFNNLKLGLAERNASHIDYAIKLFIDTMRDESETTRLRLDCAQALLDRFLGKPATAVTEGQPKQPFDVDLSPTPPAPPQRPDGPSD